MHATVLIATYNRAELLGRTLDSLAGMKVSPDLAWEVVVVNNRSTDDTADIVVERQAGFPVPLRLLFERRQGKSHAVNTGVAASAAPILAFTDDDVRVAPGWLESGVRPLLDRIDIQYTGGPVYPSWEVPPPGWIHGDPGVLAGPLALLDYGPEPFIFESRHRIALGVNMAMRRSLVERFGGFRPDLDREGMSLRGQAQAEFFFRTRRAGVQGLYVPGMSVHHHVPAARLTRRFYRQWWYSKGVARGRMQEAHPISEHGLDLRAVPHLARLPRFMWRTAVEDVVGWMQAGRVREGAARAEHEMRLAYFAGYLAGRFSASAPQSPQPSTAVVAPDSGRFSASSPQPPQPSTAVVAPETATWQPMD